MSGDLMLSLPLPPQMTCSRTAVRYPTRHIVRYAYDVPPSPQGGGIREHTLLHVRWRIPQRTQNAFHHPGEIAINVRIPESKNSKTLRLQKGVANLIRSSTLRHSVLTTVCFDNELRSERNEVDDVTADGCLSSEMKAEGFQVAQPHPQSDFLRRQTFENCAGIFICQGSPSWEASSHVIGSLPALVYTSPLWA